MTKLWQRWTDPCNKLRDFLQNMLEDWTGNSIIVGLLCAGSYFISLL